MDMLTVSAAPDPLAEAVTRALVAEHGVGPARVRVRGVGSAVPLQGRDPFHRVNDRVQFGFFG
ncbi:MAG: hypothetical protein AAFR52_00365 [Pseudomonadota bacterium]